MNSISALGIPSRIVSHVRLGEGLSWANGQDGCRSPHTEVDGAGRVSAGADAGRNAITRIVSNDLSSLDVVLYHQVPIVLMCEAQQRTMALSRCVASSKAVMKDPDDILGFQRNGW